MPPKFRPDIEGLRAFAVVSVVLYHAGLLGVSGGFVGVDVFFVISGFLITRLLLESIGEHGIRALPTFYTRRIRRLLPAAMTVVVATVVAARVWAPPLSVRPIAVDGIFTTFYGFNYRLAVEGTQYLNEGSAVSPLQHFWSLAVEEQFYLCWPILIVLIVILGRRHRNALLGVALAAIVLVSFRYSVVITGVDAPWAYFSLATRAWELALGALVALGASRLARLPGPVAMIGGWLALAAVVASAFVYNGQTPYPGSAAALPVVGAAVLIASGCAVQRGGVGVLLGLRPLQFGGRMSYSWYLWHWPMLVVAPWILGHALSWPQRLVVVVLSLAAAAITFKLIENPARSLRLPNPEWFAGGLALSGSAVVAAVLVVASLPPLVGTGANASVVHASTATPTVVREMKAAVVAGLNTKNAPRNLTPAPAQAHGDVPSSSYDGCHASIFAVTQGPCVFGDRAGKHTVVLFGDSHMQQWQPAFGRAGVYAHWRVVNWTKSGCAAQEVAEINTQLNRPYTECATWRARTLNRIAELDPAVVVMTSCDCETPNLSPAAYAEATVATVRKLQRTTTAKIVYLEDTPYPGYNVAECVASHLGDVRLCNLPLSNAYSEPRHQAIDQALQKLRRVTLVDPSRWMCADNVCPAVVGNLLVFRDQSHISVEFSEWLAPLITSLLHELQPG